MVTLRRLTAILGASLLSACATAPARRVPVDLEPARAAVKTAREDAAKSGDAVAGEALRRAEGDLAAAEAAAGSSDASARCDAGGLARATIAEAWCASAVVAQAAQAKPPAQPVTADPEKLAARARQAESDQRRLEDRVAQLQRELELTEQEVIRTKARLKGTETKAEVSSAIAEARILMRRLADDRGKAATLARCQELIARAETLLSEENYGAAAFFALKAQDTAVKTPDAAGPGPAALRSPPQQRYVVKAPQANLRRGPDTREPVVAVVTRGTALEALALRGDWVQVRSEAGSGWVHRSLVE